MQQHVTWGGGRPPGAGGGGRTGRLTPGGAWGRPPPRRLLSGGGRSAGGSAGGVGAGWWSGMMGLVGVEPPAREVGRQSTTADSRQQQAHTPGHSTPGGRSAAASRATCRCTALQQLEPKRTFTLLRINGDHYDPALPLQDSGGGVLMLALVRRAWWGWSARCGSSSQPSWPSNPSFIMRLTIHDRRCRSSVSWNTLAPCSAASLLLWPSNTQYRPNDALQERVRGGGGGGGGEGWRGG